jgi:DNA-binding transcriptional LysR family regulator
MTLEQLRVFVGVAERLHMTRGAEALHITQSAASAAIAALETRYGITLFDRVGRGLALSETGKVFLPEARAVLARAAAAVRALDDLAGLKRGSIAIAASQTVSNYWLPPYIAKFAQAFPEIELHLTGGNTAQVAQAVSDGTAELGFVEGEVGLPQLKRMRVAGDRIALYAAAGHPMASTSIRAATLSTFRWVLRESGSGTRSEFDHAIAGMGIDPSTLRIVFTLPSNEALLEAVASGTLVTVVSELAARPWVSAGRIVPLRFDFPVRSFELITHVERRRSRAATEFLGRLQTPRTKDTFM